LSRNRSSDDLPGNDPAQETASGAKTAEPRDDGADAAASIAFLQDRVARLNAEKEELRQTLLRRQADFENYRKRIEREHQEHTRRGVQQLMDQLLPILDAFERALASHKDPAYEEYRKGLELIYKQLWETLGRHGLERIDAEGKQFDPNFHQAIERVETFDHADGAVIQVMQPGYLFHGKVLRPASVRVAANPAEESNKYAS
jgi:molecular chaperone GrpE